VRTVPRRLQFGSIKHLVPNVRAGAVIRHAKRTLANGILQAGNHSPPQ
jgi:hypothetical protein